jgi:hypothetical protein
MRGSDEQNGAGQRRAGDSGPFATTDLYFRLNDMDAQVANQRAFTGAISAGQQGMNGWTGYIPAAAAIFITIGVLAGVRPRLAEYR